MNVPKYITSIILTMMALIFIGETYVWHIDGFETEYKYMTFYPQKSISQSEMISDIFNAAQKEKIEVFVVERNIKSMLDIEINIYGTAGVEKQIKTNSEIVLGEFNSIFLGKYSVKIFPLEDISDISNVETYYAIGNKDNIIQFKQNLVDKYAGAFPKDGYSLFNSKFNIAMVWSCIFFLFILLTLYNLALMKKEIIIRLVSGEYLGRFILKEMLKDFCCYFLIFVCSMFIIKLFTNAFYNYKVTIICMLCFLIINSLLYCWLFFTDYRKDLNTKKSAKTVLNISYIYKIITIIIIISVMSGGIGLIQEGINYYKQKELFMEHNDWSYIMVSSFDFDKDEKLFNNLYKNYLEQNKTFALIDLNPRNCYENNYIYADRGTVDYLRKQIQELQNIDLDEKVYILYPKAYQNNSNIRNKAIELAKSYCENDFQYVDIYYENNIKVVALEGMDGVSSILRKNPIILLSNISAEKQNSTDGYIRQATMFNISDDEWNSFVKNNDYGNEIVYKTNVYENYIFHWQKLKRGIIIGSVLFLLLFVIEGIIVKNLIMYEYYVNSVELALKKIEGYVFFSRYKKSIATTIAFGTIASLMAIIVCTFFNFSEWHNIVIGGIAVIVCELILVARSVHLMENANIQRILKGGKF